MSRKLAFVIVFFAPLFLQAQYLSQLQRFSVTEKKGCASLSVNITNTNLKPAEGICGPGNPCDITWGDNTSEQIIISTANHTYTQPGTYLLRILYQNFGFDEITITVTPNTLPAFDIFTCGGDEVQVRVSDKNYDAYIINYNDGSPEVQVPKGSMAVNNHAFTTSGIKTISVRGKDVNANDNCSSGSKDVLAMATLPSPFIRKSEVISSSQINLDFTILQNIQYRLEIATNNNTSFQVAQMVYNSTTASLTNLRNDDNFYCFRLGAFDPCNNTIAYSNIICSANLGVTPQNNVNNLSWSTNSTGVTNFDIIRNNSTINSPAAGTSLYTDNNVMCKTSYCYQLITNYANSSESFSSTKCVTAFSSDLPTPVTNATAIVTSTGVDISWQQDPAFQPVEYSVLRKEGGGFFQSINKTTSTMYTDLDYTTEAGFCYQINYIDVCDNSSPPGIEICPFRLTGDLTPENYTVLNWTAYTGWQNGVMEYRIEKYSESGVLLQTTSVGSGTTTFIDSDINPNEQVYRYVVKAVAIDSGLGEAVSNEIIIIKEPKITYPTAFTPDNQGRVENEIFRVFGQYISKFEMQIFNRWGELIFTSNNIDNGWDGTYRGNQVPDGTYAFIARLEDLTGNSYTRSGSVVLLRKK